MVIDAFCDPFIFSYHRCFAAIWELLLQQQQSLTNSNALQNLTVNNTMHMVWKTNLLPV